MVAITLTPKIKNLDKLLAHCHRRRYTAKSTIIYAGDRCETLFFIVKGSVTILIEDDDGREMIIAYLNSGDFFGEMGLFEKEGVEKERSAWVRAKTECEVAELSYAKFRELTLQDPDILFALGSQAAALRDGLLENGNPPAQIAVIAEVAHVRERLAGFPGAVFLKGSRRYQLETVLAPHAHAH